MSWLPEGQSLPEDVWRVRHRALSIVLRAHVGVILAYGLVVGGGLLHVALEAGAVGVFACAAAGRSRRVSSSAAALGLVTSSAVLVHLSGGLVEMHFHFFVMVGILTLYQSWVPFLFAIGFVVLHHGIVGTLAPGQVYNHADAIAHPLKWALVHGGFVLAASVASIVAWRLNEEQALKDSLTGLPNRRLFQDRVGHALARSQRSPRSIAVLFVDLDGFKDVNDSLGHAAGDHLLIGVARRIQSVLRSSDTAARLGGDEFAVLVEDVTDGEEPMGVAQRLCDALSEPFVVRGRTMRVGASVGIALSAPGTTVDELLRNADVAMYTVKANGRGRFEMFEPGMHATVVRRVDLEHDLQRAIDMGELVLHYQPVVSLATGRLAGFEALLRWEHPERGILWPGEFLDLAEQTGNILRIGSWVLDEACHQARRWKLRYPGYPFTMAVNLSPKQLFECDVVDNVRESLLRTGLAARDLVLELTEGMMVKDTDVTLDRLHGLKELGVQLAVDDFGTGYSSLGYLRRLPFDILKIDRLFIEGITAGPTEAAFAQAIIKLAQTLDMETVAEGVEEAEQASVLRELGCELAQGYHFAKPLTVEAVDALLAATAPEGWAERASRTTPLAPSASSWALRP